MVNSCYHKMCFYNHIYNLTGIINNYLYQVIYVVDSNYYIIFISINDIYISITHLNFALLKTINVLFF